MGHRAFVSNLLNGFTALVRAGNGNCGTIPARPFFDWPLLAMLRSCCIALDGGRVDTADIEALSACYVAAAAQLRNHAFGSHHVICVRSRSLQSWDDVDVFFPC